MNIGLLPEKTRTITNNENDASLQNHRNDLLGNRYSLHGVQECGNEISHQSGGEKEYQKKYFKYKIKYLELKSTI